MSKWFMVPLMVGAVLVGHFVSAKPEKSRHTVVGMLSLRKGEPAKLHVNPMSRSRYTLHILNTDLVARLMKKANFFGLVRVEMDVLPKLEALAPVEILKVKPVHVRRVPTYDVNFKAVANGNG